MQDDALENMLEKIKLKCEPYASQCAIKLEKEMENGMYKERSQEIKNIINNYRRTPPLTPLNHN